MYKSFALLALLALPTALPQPASARPLAATPRPKPTARPTTLAEQRQAAITRLRPLINTLCLHDQQALAVEELLLNQALADKPLAEQLLALRPVLTGAQLTRWQAVQRQVASVR